MFNKNYNTSLLDCQELKYRRGLECGKFFRITLRNFRPRPHIRKISKNTYRKIIYKKVLEEFKGFDGSTFSSYKDTVKLSEEVYTMAEKKPDENGVTRSKRSLRLIFNDLSALIRTNFASSEENQNQLFITLTYAENMQDSKRLHRDFRIFMQAVKRKYKAREFCWISIVEPQERGAWHIHMLLKDLNSRSLFLPVDELGKMWGKGSVSVEALKCNDMGSYFVAYLSNAELTNERIASEEMHESDIKIKDGKKYIKGSRLKWYPDYMQIYRHSKNVQYPKKVCNSDLVGDVARNYNKILYQGVSEINADGDKVFAVGLEDREN